MPSIGQAHVYDWNRSDLTDAFYILLSQHVGGAMIRNHQVELGENTRAGEIGHMTMIPFGKACYCGRSGCLEPSEKEAVIIRMEKQSESEKKYCCTQNQ